MITKFLYFVKQNAREEKQKRKMIKENEGETDAISKSYFSLACGTAWSGGRRGRLCATLVPLTGRLCVNAFNRNAANSAH